MAEAERDLRVTAGHWSVDYVRHNDEMKDRRLGSKAKLPIRQSGRGIAIAKSSRSSKARDPISLRPRLEKGKGGQWAFSHRS